MIHLDRRHFPGLKSLDETCLNKNRVGGGWYETADSSADSREIPFEPETHTYMLGD